MIFSFLGLSAQKKDTDGDGVLDIDDYCPNVKGSTNYYGCPDPTKPDCTEFQKEKKLLFDKLKVQLWSACMLILFGRKVISYAFGCRL